MKVDQCSETSVHKIQTPGNRGIERIQNSERGESLKAKTLAISSINTRKILNGKPYEGVLVSP
jgi:hypothetical protein